MSMRLQAISTLNNGKTMFTYTGNTAAITCLFVCIFLHQNFLLIPLSACVVTQSLKLSWGGQVINDLTTTRIFRIHIQWPESLAAGHRCVSQPSGPSWYPAVLEPSCYQNHWPVSLNQSKLPQTICKYSTSQTFEFHTPSRSSNERNNILSRSNGQSSPS